MNILIAITAVIAGATTHTIFALFMENDYLDFRKRSFIGVADIWLNDLMSIACSITWLGIIGTLTGII